MRRQKIVQFDDLLEHDDAIVSCLFNDCQHSWAITLPRRLNVAEELICPICHRDFFDIWLPEVNKLITHYGDAYDDIIASYNRSRKRRK